MKTLIINGSPRKEGDTMTLVHEMEKYLEGDIKIVHTYYDSIQPCVDCRYCWEYKGCCIQDEMQEVYKLLDEVDNVIIASPLYFSELTGQLLSFASRLQCFYALRYIQKVEYKLKNKKGVLIITGGKGKPERARVSANIIFDLMNVKVIGEILTLQTDRISAKEDEEALSKARQLVVELNLK